MNIEPADAIHAIIKDLSETSGLHFFEVFGIIATWEGQKHQQITRSCPSCGRNFDDIMHEIAKAVGETMLNIMHEEEEAK